MACGNPLRQVPEGLPLGNRPRSTRHLLAMSPDPSLGQADPTVFLGIVDRPF